MCEDCYYNPMADHGNGRTVYKKKCEDCPYEDF